MDQKPGVLFSLIVPTLGRSKELEVLLLSLTAQTLKDFELIIVDQNDDDRVGEVLKKFGHLNPIHLKQLSKGASRARNAGLRIAGGQILTFPDDDCEYPPDLLSAVNMIFGLPALGGITVSSRSRDAGSVAHFSKKGGEITKYNILSRGIEFSIFVRSRVVADQLFDEELGVGSHTPWWSDEGPDFVLRLIQLGNRFDYHPELTIYHPNPAITYDEKAFLRSYRYGCGRGRFLHKHRYPIWFVVYVWSLYVAGIFIGLFTLNPAKAKYYFEGLKGRMRGYFS